MKRYKPSRLAVLGTFALSALSAHAVVIDFESFNAGDVISGPGVFADVEFSSVDRDILIFEANPGPDFTGAYAAGGDPFSGSPFEATFSIGNVNLVSVTLGDFGSDFEDLYLRAYDSGSGLLDEDTAELGFAAAGITLSVNGGPGIISFVEFGSIGGFSNSVYFDDFSYFTTGTEPPPPPPTRVPDSGATLALVALGMGLLGAARRFTR